jgi:hypothetical protein
MSKKMLLQIITHHRQNPLDFSVSRIRPANILKNKKVLYYFRSSVVLHTMEHG